MKKRAHIIGSGFSSLAASCYLAKAGYEVNVFEKNEQLGGRASQFEKQGFLFDMGPSFYWMPDVFESFFNDFDKSVNDFYTLKKLDPAYTVVFEGSDVVAVGGDFEKIIKTFEELEPSSSGKLKKYISRAEENYNIAIKDLVYKPGESVFELMSVKTMKKLPTFFSNIRRDSSRVAEHPYTRKILQFPSLFLGAKPQDTPGFYNFMNYADFKLGTWHPLGGMHVVVRSIVKLAESLGVRFFKNSNVGEIVVREGRACGVRVNDEVQESDIVLSGADYAHTETLLLEPHRQYSKRYWKKKVFAPSSLLFYVGFDAPIKKVSHHTLFFDTDFDAHAQAIYDTKQWPKSPLFYAAFPSKTDPYMAPQGKEAAVFLIPLAIGVKDNYEKREEMFNVVIERLEKFSGQSLKDKILFSESFGVNDFRNRYNAFGGNAYGLANTLLQTHVLRPKLRSKKVKGLFFTGQLTVPGPGVPPSLISGKIVSDLIQKYHPNSQK